MTDYTMAGAAGCIPQFVIAEKYMFGENYGADGTVLGYTLYDILDGKVQTSASKIHRSQLPNAKRFRRGICGVFSDTPDKFFVVETPSDAQSRRCSYVRTFSTDPFEEIDYLPLDGLAYASAVAPDGSGTILMVTVRAHHIQVEQVTLSDGRVDAHVIDTLEAGESLRSRGDALLPKWANSIAFWAINQAQDGKARMLKMRKSGEDEEHLAPMEELNGFTGFAVHWRGEWLLAWNGDRVAVYDIVWPELKVRWTGKLVQTPEKGLALEHEA